MKSKDMKLWDDAYANGHQFITDASNKVLYERWRGTSSAEFFGVKVTANAWGQWTRVEKPGQMSKAWKVKDMSIEDFIEGNYEREPL